jgi:hypothetical protein
MSHVIKGNWYIEWNWLSHHEQTIIHVGLQLPTPKDKTFFVSLSLFTLSLFWLDINYKKDRQTFDLDAYVKDMLELKKDGWDRWMNRPDKPTKEEQ